jgi:hypothetical protein
MSGRSLMDERRLVSRVLRHWKERVVADRLPSKGEIDPWLVGDDWAHCMLVALADDPAQSTFIVVGNHLLPAPDEILDGQPLAACPADTLVSTLLRYLPRCRSDGPLSVGGGAKHMGGPVLYRSIFLPLSDDGSEIDSVFCAANYLKLGKGEENSLRTRLEIRVLEARQGQIWEVFDPTAGGWIRATVLGVDGDEVTLRRQGAFTKLTCSMADMASQAEKFRFIAGA